jgi:hypothetical protein
VSCSWGGNDATLGKQAKDEKRYIFLLSIKNIGRLSITKTGAQQQGILIFLFKCRL